MQYKNITLRILTRKDIKELSKQGINPMMNKDMDQEKMEQLVDYILDNFYADVPEVDALSYYDAVQLATKTFQNSVAPSEDEVKN